MNNYNFSKGLYWPETETHLTFFGDEYQSDIRQVAIDLIKPEFRKQCVDVGAHVGIATRHFAKFFDSVIAFEPIRTTFNCLELNTHFMTNVVRHNTALSDKVHPITFTRPDKSNTGNTIPSEEVNNSPTADLTQTLDSFNLAPQLIKIDVEGFELRVLMGAEETIKRARPIFIIECKGIGESFRDPQGPLFYLKSLGYSVYHRISHDYVLTPTNFSTNNSNV